MSKYLWKVRWLGLKINLYSSSPNQAPQQTTMTGPNEQTWCPEQGKHWVSWFAKPVSTICHEPNRNPGNAWVHRATSIPLKRWGFHRSYRGHFLGGDTPAAKKGTEHPTGLPLRLYSPNLHQQDLCRHAYRVLLRDEVWIYSCITWVGHNPTNQTHAFFA